MSLPPAYSRLRALVPKSVPSACLRPRTPRHSPITAVAGSQLSPTRYSHLRAPRRRCYHSYDHIPPPVPFSDHEGAILSAAYAHVPELGFSQRAVAAGARDAGYPDVSAAVLADGPFALARYHLVAQRGALAGRNKELFAQAQTTEQDPSKDNRRREGGQASVVERVELLTWERLLGNRAVVHRLQEALAIMAHPSYVPASLKELALLADEIWFLAGDTAVDPSWYTKRAALSAVYASSELFMTNDKSPDFGETRLFLQRRMGEVRQAGSVLGSVGEWLSFTASAGINVLRSKGVRV